MSAVRCGADRAASAQMLAKMTAETMILTRVLLFTSSVQLGVLAFFNIFLPNYPLSPISTSARSGSIAQIKLTAGKLPQGLFLRSCSLSGRKSILFLSVLFNNIVMLVASNPGKGRTALHPFEAKLHTNQRC